MQLTCIQGPVQACTTYCGAHTATASLLLAPRLDRLKVERQQSIGCTKAAVHSSDCGKVIYFPRIRASLFNFCTKLVETGFVLGGLDFIPEECIIQHSLSVLSTDL